MPNDFYQLEFSVLVCQIQYYPAHFAFARFQH